MKSVTIIHSQRLTRKQAKEFFANINAEKFRESSLWAKLNFPKRIQPEAFFESVAQAAYHCGYELVTGTLEMRVLRKEPTEVPVVFWVPQEADEDFRDDTVEHSYKHPIVEADRPWELVQQAVMIRKAYEKGFGDRSQEVRQSIAGLLGTPEQSLERILGLGDDD